MNDFLHDMKRNLSFSIDDELGKSVIIVKDSDSDEVIRQIPSEELVVLRKKMDDVAGILFDTKV
ncbi:flagellar protein FlaG [Psychromonas sp. GE-S-Ul-11]